mgnify:CR=1 FL=1
MDQSDFTDGTGAELTGYLRRFREIADRLVKAGIKAIWNFAHTDLQVPDDVVVENVHLSESLMRLSYRVCSMQDQKAREEAQRKQEEAAGAGETK